MTVPGGTSGMLKHIYVNGYKCLVNFELRPAELGLLVGPNGSGKSAVLDVLYALREVLSGSTKVSEVFPASTLTRWQTSPRQVFEIEVESAATGPLTYRLEIEHERTTGRARVNLERLSAPTGPLFEFSHGTVHLYRDDHTPGPEFPGDWSESWLARFREHPDNPRPARFLDFMRRMVVCRVNPQGIAAESRGEDAVLARDGGNFAAWFRGVMQERPEVLPKLLDTLQQTIGGLTGVRLERVGQDARRLTVDFDYQGTAYGLSLDEVSDGQRSLILLYALLHFSAGQGYTLLLDEPDNFLALAEIQPWLMALSDACGETVSQAILCSHHPELIDYLGPEYGLLLDRDSSGPVVVRSLDGRDVDGGLKLSEIVARGWEL